MVKTILSNMFFFSVIVAAVVLGGCSDFEEMKGMRLMMQAEALIEQGAELDAEKKLAELISLYPNTQAGKSAVNKLYLVQKRREQKERSEFATILDSYQQVLDGYRSLYSEYPRSLTVLDQSDYFFDSEYLNEITPNGFQVYLWLSDDGQSYRAWCVADDKERGYAIEPARGRLVAFERNEVLLKIKTSFEVVSVGDNLAVLHAN